MNQIKANNSAKKPIPMRTADLMTERVETLAVGSVVSRLLSDDANQIANISNDVSVTLMSVSSLLRVMADAMAVPLTDQCSTTEDKRRLLSLMFVRLQRMRRTSRGTWAGKKNEDD